MYRVVSERVLQVATLLLLTERHVDGPTAAYWQTQQSAGNLVLADQLQPRCRGFMVNVLPLEVEAETVYGRLQLAWPWDRVSAATTALQANYRPISQFGQGRFVPNRPAVARCSLDADSPIRCAGQPGRCCLCVREGALWLWSFKR